MGGVPPTPVGGIVAPLVDVGTGERRRLDRLAVDGRIALVDWASAERQPERGRARAGAARRGRHGAELPDGRPVLPGPGRARIVRLPLALAGASDDHTAPGGRRRPPQPDARWRPRAPRARRRAGPRHLRSQRRRLPPWRALVVAARRRCAPRRMVPCGLRQRVGRRRDAGDRARARTGRPSPRPQHLLHVAHRRGVRPPGVRVRLVHRRLAAGQRHAPGVGGIGAVPPLRRGERPSGPAAEPAGAARARALRARHRSRREGRGLADERMAARRTRHRHRAVAAARLRHPGHRRVHLGAVVRAGPTTTRRATRSSCSTSIISTG